MPKNSLGQMLGHRAAKRARLAAANNAAGVNPMMAMGMNPLMASMFPGMMSGMQGSQQNAWDAWDAWYDAWGPAAAG